MSVLSREDNRKKEREKRKKGVTYEVKSMLPGRLLPKERQSWNHSRRSLSVVRRNARGSVVSRRAWRRATVCSLEAEKGCRLVAAMLSGIDVAFSCNSDSTVGRTSEKKGGREKRRANGQGWGLRHEKGHAWCHLFNVIPLGQTQKRFKHYLI
jgi:hypothetical protein